MPPFPLPTVPRRQRRRSRLGLPFPPLLFDRHFVPLIYEFSLNFLTLSKPVQFHKAARSPCRPILRIHGRQRYNDRKRLMNTEATGRPHEHDLFLVGAGVSAVDQLIFEVADGTLIVEVDGDADVAASRTGNS